MVHSKDTRRETKLGDLDIDRRKVSARRDDSRRKFIDEAYKTIYIPAYVNLIYPNFPVKIHAFSNLIEELSPAEWVVNTLAVEQAQSAMPLLGLREFARILIDRGMVTNSKGENISAKNADLTATDCYFLKTGT
ncbi:MAG: hypothetical protein H7318_02625 [Oligoflexus sp.]|nr:hypothetical protein [Oligoflexus sp.]